MSNALPQWRTGRVWQGLSAYIVIELLGSRSHTQRKAYLVADTINGSFSIETTKPTDLKPTSAFSEIVKKHLKHGLLIGQSQTDSLKSLVIRRIPEDETQDYAYFCFEKGSTPTLHFVSNHNSLVRMTSKGVFTKTMTFSPDIATVITPLPLATEKGENKISNNDLTPEYKHAIQRLKRKARTLQKSILKTDPKVSSALEIELQKEKISLLTLQLGNLQPPYATLSMLSETTGKVVEIELDPDISPGKNLDLMYKKLKKMERSREIGSIHLAKLKSEHQALTHQIATLSDSMVSATSLEAIYKRFQIPAEVQKKKQALEDSNSKPYREFFGKDGSVFWVGKSALDNDVLCKKAKGNDYWFHVTSGTGSHVILPAKSLKHKALSPSLIREGAILAIHFSKARATQASEIQYTQRSFLKKTKGAPPGMWLVERAESLFIRYEINELKQILETANRTQ